MTDYHQGAAVYQCSFNPIDNTVVCVTGDGICRFLRINEQARSLSSLSTGAFEGASPDILPYIASILAVRISRAW